ncbi:MAG: WG repeat-containing protein, partial [Muribaculaceae bacterium]|nr:WG repeat-containing protein [Muribaculaceae bacterium]
MPDILKIGKQKKFAYIAIIIFMTIFASCSENVEKSDSIEYIPVQLEKNGYWSLMSRDGKIKFENEFKEAPSVVINGLFSVKEGEGYSVYRADGEKPELVKGLENLSQVGTLRDGLMPIAFPDKRIVIVDKEGNEKFELKPIKDKEIIKCDGAFYEGMLWTRNEDSKVGYYNTSGECVIAHRYDNGYSFSEGKALVCNDSLWSAIGKDGKKIFTFKKGQSPVIDGRYTHNKIFMKDAEGRFYVYNEKGESTKLSTKIKEVSEFNENYIIYKSDSGEYGLMDYKGEVVLRPKYKSLQFGEDGKLLASRKEGEWEILDYSGNKIIDLDYSEVTYCEDFGYFVQDKSGCTILNEKGDPISKEVDFYQWCVWADNFGIGYLVYVPTDKIISQLVDMFNDNGIGDYKFGESMVALAQKQQLDKSGLIKNRRGDILLVSGDCRGDFYLSLEAWSQYVIAYEATSYNYYSGFTNSPTWNHNSKVDGLLLKISAHGSDWAKGGVSRFADAFKKKGFEVSKIEANNSKTAILLIKDNLKLYITNPWADMVLI